ncbi:MAG: hypothetical protein JOZ55_03655 [Alphaproteobacteria bacterium]|nr:hypothetical protein [Alphaproteobacteria bacterium]
MSDAVPDEADKPNPTLRSVQARQRQIGRELERLWGGVVREAVPEEMLDLLKRLDDRDRGKKDG